MELGEGGLRCNENYKLRCRVKDEGRGGEELESLLRGPRRKNAFLISILGTG